MGSETSQFEQKFYHLNKFVQVVNDPNYGTIKIYRKSIPKYDYFAVITRTLIDLQSSETIINQRLAAIIKSQNETTIKLYNYRFLEESKIQCRNFSLKIYAEYHNIVLQDYLSALRRRRITLSVQEMLYTIKTLAQGIITLKKMGIKDFELTSNNIYLNIEGEVLVSPLLYLWTSIKETQKKEQLSQLTNKYTKYSLSFLSKSQSKQPSVRSLQLNSHHNHHNHHNHLNHPSHHQHLNHPSSLLNQPKPFIPRYSHQTPSANSNFSGSSYLSRSQRTSPYDQNRDENQRMKRNIQRIFTELTGFIDPCFFYQCNQIAITLDNSDSVEQIFDRLPDQESQNLAVEKITQDDDTSNGQLYMPD